MWRRTVEWLTCPICKGDLRLLAFEEERISLASEHREAAEARGLDMMDFDRYVEGGALLCDACRVRFPVIHGATSSTGVVTS